MRLVLFCIAAAALSACGVIDERFAFESTNDSLIVMSHVKPAADGSHTATVQEIWQKPILHFPPGHQKGQTMIVAFQCGDGTFKPTGLFVPNREGPFPVTADWRPPESGSVDEALLRVVCDKDYRKAHAMHAPVEVIEQQWRDRTLTIVPPGKG